MYIYLFLYSLSNSYLLKFQNGSTSSSSYYKYSLTVNPRLSRRVGSWRHWDGISFPRPAKHIATVDPLLSYVAGSCYH